ncbi:unnamed protein product [Paramecium sonneborni]|uniref:Mitogen-activated protein kinase n=1 Tax=Paramecium sonneborni TaxID=65129 RepID=A0A8S1PCL0_9CILI|nr:unnamed protein product [Paramecium sonneborni]
MLSPSQYQQLQRLSPQRVSMPGMSRVPAFVKTREVRMPSPAKQYSPTKYVIHNPPLYIRSRMASTEDIPSIPSEQKNLNNDRKYSMHMDAKTQQISHLNEIISQQQQQILTQESKVALLQNEVNAWKQKFIELNQKYHQMQENENIDEHILKKYEVIQRIGKGAYGIVWKAKDLKSLKIVALKKVFDAFNNPTDAQRTYREVTFLKQLKHPNIVSIIETYPANNKIDLYIVFEYMETDLHIAIRANILQAEHRRYITYQLIKALKYIHSAGMIHRDLKPANILIDSECQIKLADFGLARMVGSHDSDILTDYVATRWFRAPEILLGSKSYSYGIDLWSVGCLMGEMILGKALFSGNSTINQLEKIVDILGNPNQSEILAMGGQSQIFQNQFRPSKQKLNSLLGCPKDELDIISKLLQYDPTKRLSIEDCLKHSYFKEYRNTKEEINYHGSIMLQLQDDKQYPISTYRDVLYKKMDYSRIITLVNKQKKIVEDLALKKQQKSFKQLIEQKSVQTLKQYRSSQFLKNTYSNSNLLDKSQLNKSSQQQQQQLQQQQQQNSTSNIKNKLRSICQQSEARQRSAISKQSNSSSKYNILHNVTNTSLSPHSAINSRYLPNRFHQKHNDF